jgi:hypothetical protein
VTPRMRIATKAIVKRTTIATPAFEKRFLCKGGGTYGVMDAPKSRCRVSLRLRAAPVRVRGGLFPVLRFAPNDFRVWYRQHLAHEGVEACRGLRAFDIFRRLHASIVPLRECACIPPQSSAMYATGRQAVAIDTPLLSFVPYCTLVQGATKMVRVQWEADGPFALCDTPAEAAELLGYARKTTNGNHRTASESPLKATTDGKSVAEKVAWITGKLTDKSRRLLGALAAYPQGVSAKMLSEQCGVDQESFGGTLGSVSKNAKKMDLDFEGIVRSYLKEEGDHNIRWMAPGKILLDHKNKFL